MNDIELLNAPAGRISVKNANLQTPIRNFLEEIGEDPQREGLKDTPIRFEKTIKYLLSGYDRNFKDEVSVFENHSKYKDIILFKNVDFFSMCEHHFLPFFGYAHVAYVPSEESYMGISKLARVVDIYARRLQNQENIGLQIANDLMQHGKAKGVAVLLEGRHLCSVARGVEKKTAIMTTCAYYGSFENNPNLQQNFMELVRDREKI
ncbi:MAG TPA: GTP cyclohydrolase I FolE [Candidatus Saccharimonadales bacterium]|nr:GTP cyclohydrolase I FolE [Candidatus Saccharimonadales bacterium]